VLHQVVRKHLGGLPRTLKEEARTVSQFTMCAWRSCMDCGFGGAALRTSGANRASTITSVALRAGRRDFARVAPDVRWRMESVHLVDRVFPDVNMQTQLLEFPLDLRGMPARGERQGGCVREGVS
jgi:hypothetical protein